MTVPYPVGRGFWQRLGCQAGEAAEKCELEESLRVGQYTGHPNWVNQLSLIPLCLSCLVGAFPPPQGQKEAVSRAMTLSNVWILLIQSFAFLSGYLWYHVIQYFYHCLF